MFEVQENVLNLREIFTPTEIIKIKALGSSLLERTKLFLHLKLSRSVRADFFKRGNERWELCF